MGHVTRAVVILLMFALPALGDVLSGKVLDSQGAPVAGAQVYLILSFEPADSTRLPAAQTDAAGVFTVNFDVKPGAEVRSVRALAWSAERGIGIAGPKREDVQRLTLLPFRTVQGVLKDEAGRPVANAETYVQFLHGPRAAGQSWPMFVGLPPELLRTHFTAKSDARGRWQLQHLPQGAGARLIVNSDGYATPQVEVSPDQAPSGPIQTVLRLAGRVEGRVVYEDGKPAGGISVVAQGCHGTAAMLSTGGKAATDENGRYSMTGFVPGEYNVAIDLKDLDWTAAARERVAVSGGGTVRQVDLTLIKGIVLKGKVIDEESKAGLPGVSVGSYGPHRPRSSSMVHSTKTDERGEFLFRLPPGNNHVYVQGAPEGYLRPADSGVVPRVRTGQAKDEPVQRADAQDVLLRAGEEPSPLTFSLRRAGEVSGLVVDEKGSPVPGARVTVQQGGDPWDPPTATTDKDGRFRLRGVARQGVISLKAQTPTQWSGPLTLQGENLPREPLRLVLSSPESAMVKGRVVDVDGKPVSGVRVEMSALRPFAGGMYMPEPARTATTDEKGEFRFGNVEGSWDIGLRVAYPGYRYLRGGSVPKGKDQPRLAEDIVLMPLAARMTGQVVGSDGAAREGALVFVAGFATDRPPTTDKNGRFTLTELPQGPVKIVALHGKRSWGAVECQSAATEALIRLSDPGPPDWSRSPTDEEKKLAKQLIEEAWDYSRQHRYYAREALPMMMSSIALDRAREMLLSDTTTRNRDWTWTALLVWLAKNSPTQATDALQLLDEIQNPVRRANAAAGMAFYLATSDKRSATDLFERALGMLPDEDKSPEAVWVASYLGATAARLSRPEAERLLDQAIARAKQLDRDSDSTLAGLAQLLVSTHPALADRVFGEIKNDAGKRHMRASSITDLVAADPSAAVSRFRQTFPGDGAITDDEEMRCAKRIAWCLAGEDVEGALRLARRITDPAHKGQALTAIAQRQKDKPAAARILNEAASMARSVPLDMPAHLARVAQAAGAVDPTAAEQLFEEAIASNARIRGARPSSFELAFRLAALDPNRARLLIEQEFSRRRVTAESGRAVQEAAMAMCPIDFDRALELARTLKDAEGKQRSSDYCETLRKLAQWLLASGHIRQTLDFARWRAGDTWTPGEETHW